MSIHAVKQYLAEVEKIIHYGGTRKEMAIRDAFQHLLNEYAKQKGFSVLAESPEKGLGVIDLTSIVDLEKMVRS